MVTGNSELENAACLRQLREELGRVQASVKQAKEREELRRNIWLDKTVCEDGSCGGLYALPCCVCAWCVAFMVWLIKLLMD